MPEETLWESFFDPKVLASLRSRVRDALVDYAGLKAIRGDLDRYLALPAAVDKTDFGR